MKDRRVRLRPKDGARQLYYSVVNNVNARGQNLFDNSIPWRVASAVPSLAPNFPNILSSVKELPRITSDIFNNITDTAVNTISNFSFTDFASNMIGRSFGQGQGRSSIGDNINILEPLAQTDGLVWPFTPSINLSQQVDYSSYDTVHSNQELMAYTRSRAPQLTITGPFIIQNSFEAAYALAAIHFLRTVVKMDFGNQTVTAGTPPPVILLDAYGEYMFNDVPVLIQSFSADFPPDVDYVAVPNTDTVIPSLFTLSVSCIVQNTPNKLRQFNLEQFRRGKLVKNGGWL